MADIKDLASDDAAARLHDEHRRIKDAMAGLQEVTDLGELLHRLEQFRTLLTGHFHEEGAPDGFFEVLRGRASGAFGRLADLEREHWTLLAEIDALADAARDCLAGPVAAVFARAISLVRHLDAHEAAEAKLLMDTLYTDISAH